MRLITPPLLVIRADAAPEIGAGHVLRCLALAQAWQDRGGAAVFVTARGFRELRDRVEGAGCEVVTQPSAVGTRDDALATQRIAMGRGAAWLVVDGYGFEEEYLRVVRASAIPTLLLADEPEQRMLPADCILAIGAERASRGPTGATQLGGLSYALLRREFRDYAAVERVARPRARRFLLTVGGSDPHGVARPLLAALQHRLSAETELIVLGDAGALANVPRHAAGPTIHLKQRCSDIAAWLARADVVICGGGVTALEACACGTPTVLIPLASNQRANAESLRAAGAAQVVADWDAVRTPRLVAAAVVGLARDEVRRAGMMSAARGLIDGRGAERVVEHLLTRVPAECRA